uniref:Uncharacterized protein n=1 Tax=Trichuris muris TaxID=70415 RepID=A0A5S6QRA2_TRIMR
MKEPMVLRNKIREYPPTGEASAQYEEELEELIKNGWLIPYDENEYRAAEKLILLMAVSHCNKGKVMDFRELNEYIQPFAAVSGVCAQELRQGCKQGVNVSLVDLKRAHLQIRVYRSVWQYQTVVYKGRRYCLTRLGFGLNVGLLIMKAC